MLLLAAVTILAGQQRPQKTPAADEAEDDASVHEKGEEQYRSLALQTPASPRQQNPAGRSQRRRRS